MAIRHRGLTPPPDSLLAATARDIYAAPALLGAALLIALDIGESQRLGRQDGRDPFALDPSTGRGDSRVRSPRHSIVVGIGNATSNGTSLAEYATTLGEYTAPQW